MSNPGQSTVGDVNLIPGIIASLGYSYDPFFDRYKTLIPIIALRHYPPGPEPADCSFYPEDVGAHLVARAILYWGQCAGQSATQAAATANFAVSAGSQTGISLATHFAQAGNSIASAIPIVGSLVGVFDSIFGAITAHHAQAVQTEQATICEAIQAFNQVCPVIDSQVRSGQITAEQGTAAFSQLVTNVKAILAPVSGAGSGGHPCNAGCCYQAVLDAHLDFAKTFYMDITPLGAGATPPQTYSPASSASTALAQGDALFPPSGSPTVAPPISSNVLFLLLLLAFGIIWYVGIR